MATTSKSKNVLIGCSGSVASVKLEPLVASIKSWLENASIKVILTESAQHFTAVRECTEAVQYYTDADEWAVSINSVQWIDLTFFSGLEPWRYHPGERIASKNIGMAVVQVQVTADFFYVFISALYGPMGMYVCFKGEPRGDDSAQARPTSKST